MSSDLRQKRFIVTSQDGWKKIPETLPLNEEVERFFECQPFVKVMRLLECMK